MLWNVDLFSTNILQQPDSLSENESFSPFKENLIIETKNSNDTSVIKLVKQKQNERANNNIIVNKINRWDTLEFSDINIDSIAFIYATNIYNINYLANFLEQIIVFKPHELKNDSSTKKSNNNIIKNNTSFISIKNENNKSKKFPNEWSISIIIVLLLLLLGIKFYRKKFIYSLFMSTVNYQIANKNYKENNSMSIKINFILVVIFLINISFFITLYLNNINFSYKNVDGIILFIIVLALLSVFYFLKFILFKIIGYIFNISSQISEYYYKNFIFNKVLGIILIPASIILPFIKLENIIFLYKIILFLILIIALYKLLYSIFTAFKLKLSIYYLILYLCALEILPAIAVLKFVIK